MKKIILLLKLILRSKFIFKTPKKYDLIVFDKTSLEDLNNLVSKYNFFVLQVRLEDMDEIYLKDNVFISREYLSDDIPIKIYTSYAIFYLPKNLVETDRDVTIITSDSKTTGSGLSANMDTGIITILSNAKRTIRENDKFRIIEGNQMIYDSIKEKWIVKNIAANDLKKIISKKVTTTFNVE